MSTCASRMGILRGGFDRILPSKGRSVKNALMEHSGSHCTRPMMQAGQRKQCDASNCGVGRASLVMSLPQIVRCALHSMDLGLRQARESPWTTSVLFTSSLTLRPFQECMEQLNPPGGKLAAQFTRRLAGGVGWSRANCSVPLMVKETCYVTACRPPAGQRQQFSRRRAGTQSTC